jgi:hypothetical protein
LGPTSRRNHGLRRVKEYFHNLAATQDAGPVLPPARDGRDHPIDRIVDAYFAKNQVQPPAWVDDETFIRRVYLDVIGM